MILIGLTGSIASGKSTTVNWLKELGLHVDDADANVHYMFKHNKDVIEGVRKLWPGCVNEEGVDRACLRQTVLHNETAIKQLEAITHPVVRQMSLQFLAERKKAGDPVVFLDIPLLFESGGEKRYDATLVVYCSPENQRQRALARGMEGSLYDYLLSKQVPTADKIKKADFLLNTDGTLAETKEKLIEVLHQIEQKFSIKILG